MGHYQFRLPDIGEGVAEAEIVAWHVKVGDHIHEDDALLDVMTDKATVDMSSPVEGTVTALHGAIGEKAPVGSVLVEMEIEGPQDSQVSQQGEEKASRAAHVPTASPATRRQAREWGIDLNRVQGTGPEGRILAADLDHYRAGAPPPVQPPGDEVEEIRVMGLRRQIAERMAQSKRQIPHFSYVEECDVTELEKLRAELNAEGDRPKLTILAFLVRGLAKLTPSFPDLNAHYDQDQGVLRRHKALHIGIATQTPNGLMVPVVRHAERRDLWDCAAEVARVAEAAREGRAQRKDLTGSTITLTSLGVLGGIAATPIINPPEVAIIGPNRVVERAQVDGAFLGRRKMMNLSSSFDHRIVDGHQAARFIQQLKRLLEHPALLFLD